MASIWTTSGKWHIGDLATYVDQTWLIVDYLVKERKIRKIASFYQDDEYGYGVSSPLWDYVFGTRAPRGQAQPGSLQTDRQLISTSNH